MFAAETFQNIRYACLLHGRASRLSGTCPRGQTESILSSLIPQSGSLSGRAGRVMHPAAVSEGWYLDGNVPTPRLYAWEGHRRHRWRYQPYQSPKLRPVFGSQQNDSGMHEIEKGIV